MDLKLPSIQRDLLENAVVVTGLPRSGTTILGKIVGSFAPLDYHFEPPTFYFVCAAYAAGELSLPAARALLQVHLTESLLLESTQGRGVNLRPSDDSQVLNRMSWADLHARWANVNCRADAIEAVQRAGVRLAIKMPMVIDAMALLSETLPRVRVVIAMRDGNDVVRSILRKGWLTDEGLMTELWPYVEDHERDEGVNIPYWVAPDDRERWEQMSSATRTCLMWAHHAERALEIVATATPGAVVCVRYEDLVEDPSAAVADLAAALEVTSTPYTTRWLEEVRATPASRVPGRRHFAADVELAVLARFDAVNARWGYTASAPSNDGTGDADA